MYVNCKPNARFVACNIIQGCERAALITDEVQTLAVRIE